MREDIERDRVYWMRSEQEARHWDTTRNYLSSIATGVWAIVGALVVINISIWLTR